MNIIITGHKGYIGSVLKKYLEGFGYRVYGLDLRDVPSNDYTGIRRLITAIPYEVDAVVHLGAHSLLGPSVKDPFSYYDNNVVRSTDMLKALINSGWRGKFIFASSAAVYGNNDAHLVNYHNNYNLVQEPYYFKLANTKFKLMHLPFYMNPDADVVIFGHTHIFECDFKNNTLFLNPGEACARNKPLSECAMLEVDKNKYAVTYYSKNPKEDTFNESHFFFERTL